MTPHAGPLNLPALGVISLGHPWDRRGENSFSFSSMPQRVGGLRGDAGVRLGLPVEDGGGPPAVGLLQVQQCLKVDGDGNLFQRPSSQPLDDRIEPIAKDRARLKTTHE